ncbi:hypothetical protein [Epilithonimonas hominis]|uniref:hypothetical protein n=1 Tax=Epilithonimonas hominis TaxID=420404 RepID=UPI00289F7651|nr:hypothetical protein [Epilithonimonas hominis]
MDNQQQNEGTKSSGIELLENVIKSNERNISSNMKNLQSKAELRADIEDLVLAIGQMQLYFEAVNEFHNETLKFYEVEQSKRAEFLANIPTKTETVLSQETIDFYDNLERKMKRKEKIIWSGFGTFILGIFTLIFSINFATNWYKESIKSKSELRQDILNEIAEEGKKIYNENEITILRENTEIMQLWIKNNPKKAEDFLRFKEGFEARKESR